MATMNNESQKYLAEIQGLENFADREKLVKEWLGCEEYYDALDQFFGSLYVYKCEKMQAILAYFREINGVDDAEQPADLNAGERTPVTPAAGLSAEFVRDLLAAKDKQINTLLDILAKTKARNEAAQ